MTPDFFKAYGDYLFLLVPLVVFGSFILILAKNKQLAEGKKGKSLFTLMSTVVDDLIRKISVFLLFVYLFMKILW